MVFGLSRISETILTGAAMFTDTKSAISIAGVFTSPTKSALTDSHVRDGKDFYRYRQGKLVVIYLPVSEKHD